MLSNKGNITIVKFTGWEPGVRKIKFMRLLHEEGKLNLKLAKEIKDKVIGGGEIVEVDFYDAKMAKLIYTRSRQFNVKCELVQKT